MVNSINLQTQKPGACPHGLPAAACPICSGMGGGGGGGKKADFSAKPGEMSWAECYAIGQLMKAQQLRAKIDKADNTNFAMNVLNFQKSVAGLMQRIGEFMQRALPAPVLRIADVIVNKVIIPAFNAVRAAVMFVQQLPLMLTKALEELRQRFLDISDKLAAIYGEIKTAIEEKLAKPLKRIAKKLFRLLGMFSVEEEEEIYKAVESLEQEDKDDSTD